MTEHDAQQLGDELEREAEHMQSQNDRLGDEIHRVGEDWQRKRADESVPGAQPPQPQERSPQESSGEDEDPARQSPAGGEGAPS